MSPSTVSQQQSRLRFRESFPGDLAGGIAAGLIALPQALALGTLIFLPLGVEYLGVGIAAGLICSIFGGLAGGATGGAPFQISCARASTSIILAAMVAGLHALRVPEVTIIALVFASVMAAGLLQVLLSWLQLGKALKFIPHPVLAGFMYGVAVLILLQQIRPLLGLEPDVSWVEVLLNPARWKPASLVVGLLTIAAVLMTPRMTRTIPAALVGLLSGTLVFILIRAVLGPDALGAVLGAVPELSALQWTPPVIVAHAEVLQQTDVRNLWIATAMLLATVGSIDSLLGSAIIDAATGSHQRGNKVLQDQGVGNLLSGMFGGVFLSTTTFSSIGNHQNGGRTHVSGLVHSLVLLGLLVAAGSALAHIPLVVLAGIMVTFALTLFDDWSKDLLQRLQGVATHRKEMVANLAIVALVGSTTVLVNIPVAVLIGVAATTTLLLVNMSTSIVYRVFDGNARSSHRMRPAHEVEALRELGPTIAVAELTGYIFFGTADHMRSQIEALSHRRKVVILDFRRVHEVEASGARVISMMAKSLKLQGVQLALSHVRFDEPLGLYLRAMGVESAIATERWFTDLDRALEWAENEVLADLPPAYRIEAPSEEISLEASTLFECLGVEESSQVRSHMQRREYSAGEPIFLEGDAGDRLYVVVKGQVSVKLRVPGTVRAQRLAAFGPGLVFGEMALLEGSPRSADAYAKLPTVLWSLDADSLRSLRQQSPAIAIKILEGFTRQLAIRLRATSDQLRKSY